MTSASSSASPMGKRAANASTMRHLREPICAAPHTTPADLDARQVSCGCSGELRNTWEARGPSTLDFARIHVQTAARRDNTDKQQWFAVLPKRGGE